MKGCVKVVVGVLVMMLAGCAIPPKPQLSREEWRVLTTRHYDGVTVDAALDASEKLFRLADGEDFTISYTEDSLQAHRRWSVYMVIAAAFGTDSWVVKARPDGDGTLVTVQVSSQAGSVMPMPTVQGDISVGAAPTMSGPMVQGNATYNLFWSRMDYLLGKTDHWVDCDEFYQWEKDGRVWGSGEVLCNGFNVADKSPVPGAAEQRALKRELDSWERGNDSWRSMPEHLRKFKAEQAAKN